MGDSRGEKSGRSWQQRMGLAGNKMPGPLQVASSGKQQVSSLTENSAPARATRGVKGAGNRQGRATRPGAHSRITCSWGLEHRSKEGSADGVGVLSTEGGQGSCEQAGG